MGESMRDALLAMVGLQMGLKPSALSEVDNMFPDFFDIDHHGAWMELWRWIEERFLIVVPEEDMASVEDFDDLVRIVSRLAVPA